MYSSAWDIHGAPISIKVKVEGRTVHTLMDGLTH